jgi:uncharacterized membrane protein YjjB (DUF3815 family)
MKAAEIIVAATVTLVALYLFVAQGNQSSQFIGALASGYTSSVKALQGR